jgi:hypothetical protein
MRNLILILSLAVSLGGTAFLSACAQLQADGADAGATGVQKERSPYPKSMNLG